MWGCSGFSPEVQKDDGSQVEETEERALGLYESMVDVFEEDTPGIDRATEETLTVVSHYEPVDEERRRRYVGRIVPLRGGIGVRITAEYQTESQEADSGWEDQPRGAVEAEAGPEELSLARSVERRYYSGD